MDKMRKEIYTKAMKFLIFNIANDYLEYIDNYKSNDAPEIILKYLDNSVNMALNIENINLILSDSDNIIEMNRNQKREFEKATKRDNKFTTLCKKLNYVYAIIKEENTREDFINKLFKSYDEYEEKFYNQEKENIISTENIIPNFSNKYFKSNYVNNNNSCNAF